MPPCRGDGVAVCATRSSCCEKSAVAAAIARRWWSPLRTAPSEKFNVCVYLLQVLCLELGRLATRPTPTIKEKGEVPNGPWSPGRVVLLLWRRLPARLPRRRVVVVGPPRRVLEGRPGRRLVHETGRLRPRCLPRRRVVVRAALGVLQQRLSEAEPGTDAVALQSIVYEVGKTNGFGENLRDWFKAIYEVLLGQSQGPRFGSFIALYGISETRELISAALDGELTDD